ncbi:MAG: HAMP domain-containing histidine kinase [Archangiaceae bacterium]|nr:HAMP domain-containing histidine kinase [Archangiaceae bacterium]
MFIGILGHDLRTPLGAISVGAALLLRRDRLAEKDQRIVARIMSSTERMSRMITQLLDLTRARLGGGLPLEKKPADLAELCRLTVEEFEAHVELEVRGDLTGQWDSDRLTEALSNLTGNALEYATPGTPVRLVARADGDHVVVEVKNEGAPIASDVLPFIFEPFRRGKQNEKSPTGNLGLGLYIARQILLAHGGTLDAGSAAGTTTFVMRLPR